MNDQLIHLNRIWNRSSRKLRGNHLPICGIGNLRMFYSGNLNRVLTDRLKSQCNSTVIIINIHSLNLFITKFTKNSICCHHIKLHPATPWIKNMVLSLCLKCFKSEFNFSFIFSKSYYINNNRSPKF